MFNYFLLFVFSFFISYALFLPSLALSYKIGAVDYPAGRKMHLIPTARAGGFAFFIAFSSLMAFLEIDVELKYSLLIGGAIMFTIGLIDDARPLLPIQKLTGEALAAALFVCFVPRDSAFMGIFSFAWIIFLTNATNLCDGLNGLAGGICASQALCLAVISLILDNSDVLVCSLILSGAILGFLPHNFPNAKIFMGDCGALFLGFTLAALSSRLLVDGVGVLIPLSFFFVFRIPIFDTVTSIVRRAAKGKNPLSADRGHLHHKLLDMSFSKECAALLLVAAALLFGLVGVLIASLQL